MFLLPLLLPSLYLYLYLYFSTTLKLAIIYLS
jgi:hypothetical protein